MNGQVVWCKDDVTHGDSDYDLGTITVTDDSCDITIAISGCNSTNNKKRQYKFSGAWNVQLS